MWLHNTETSELHYFSTAEDVPGGYTILSHVWDQRGEQTFQEVQAIWVEYRKATVSRDVLHRNGTYVVMYVGALGPVLF